MKKLQLPPLPPLSQTEAWSGYTADDLHAYARAALAQQDEAITWATQGVEQIVAERDALKAEVERLRAQVEQGSDLGALRDMLRAEVDRLLAAPAQQAWPPTGSWVSASDVAELTRRLDIALNGAEGAARQASLCDIVSQAEQRAAQQAAPSLTVGERASSVIATAPERIWLNLFDAPENTDGDKLFPADHEGITWAEDEVGDYDVQYIRADLAQPAAQAEPVPAKLEDFCGVMQEIREAETARGTKHRIAKWTCPKCSKACSMLELDGEWCHGDGLSISFRNGERIVGCSSCWLTDSKPAAQGVDLPPLPQEPYATHAIWTRTGETVAWDQWHTADDPMPETWEGGDAPDQVIYVFTADQMYAHTRAALAHHSQAPAAEPQEPDKWALYVAGMVVAYLGGGVDDERIKPIAGIIARRLWVLKPGPADEAPDGAHEALQRLIENAAAMGPASRDDARLVAKWRRPLLAPRQAPAA
jgi:hypothetical protein